MVRNSARRVSRTGSKTPHFGHMPDKRAGGAPISGNLAIGVASAATSGFRQLCGDCFPIAEDVGRLVAGGASFKLLEGSRWGILCLFCLLKAWRMRFSLPY